jgi:predicted RNase H-like HicB family nuclease
MWVMSKKINQYYIIYEIDEKGGYVASAPAIPGCAVYGKTIKQAHANIQSAIKECLEVRREFRKNIPKETMKLDKIRKFSFVKVSGHVKA